MFIISLKWVEVHVISYDLKNDGLFVITDAEICDRAFFLRSKLETVYLSKFSDSNPTLNRNLLRRFTQDPLCLQLFFSSKLISYVRTVANVFEPNQTSPIVSHFTSHDVTGQGHGLGFHQDWPSMGTSDTGIVCWITLYDTDRHTIQFVPGSHKKGVLPGKQTETGYLVEPTHYTDAHVLRVPAGSVVLFSPWLVHATYVDPKAEEGAFKLALSTRYDDLECAAWQKRGYESAYSTTVDRQLWSASLEKTSS